MEQRLGDRQLAVLAFIRSGNGPVSVAALCAQFDVPDVRTHAVLHRLEAAGLVTVVGGSPRRLSGAMVEVVTEPRPAATPRRTPSRLPDGFWATFNPGR